MKEAGHYCIDKVKFLLNTLPGHPRRRVEANSRYSAAAYTHVEMRGQVTAIYLFMFIGFGALGGQLIGTVTQRVFGAEADLWKSIALTASVLTPLAAFAISRGIRPYGREVEHLEALEKAKMVNT